MRNAFGKRAPALSADEILAGCDIPVLMPGCIEATRMCERKIQVAQKAKEIAAARLKLHNESEALQLQATKQRNVETEATYNTSITKAKDERDKSLNTTKCDAEREAKERLVKKARVDNDVDFTGVQLKLCDTELKNCQNSYVACTDDWNKVRTSYDTRAEARNTAATSGVKAATSGLAPTKPASTKKGAGKGKSVAVTKPDATTAASSRTRSGGTAGAAPISPPHAGVGSGPI